MHAAEKKRLRARAHPLKPVVILGQAGLKTSVIAEIEQALDSYELIKIKIRADDRELRKKQPLIFVRNAMPNASRALVR